MLDNIARPICLAPGDTKMSSNWHDTTSFNQGALSEQTWMLTVEQVASYTDKPDTRYGSIVTDRKLTVLLFRREAISPGIASTRSRRPHQRVCF